MASTMGGALVVVAHKSELGAVRTMNENETVTSIVVPRVADLPSVVVSEFPEYFARINLYTMAVLRLNMKANGPKEYKVESVRLNISG